VAERSRPTSHDVARAAGVSQSTVSLVLSGRWAGRVSAATAERVRRSAEGLRYQPNLAARALRLERAGTVLLLVPVLTNPFFGHLHMGVARAADEHEIGVVVCPLQAEDGSGPLPLPRQVLDGVITCSIDDTVSPEHWRGLRWVALDSAPATTDAVINMDVADGLRQSVRHLVGLGHRRLGYVRAGRSAWTFATRYAAVRDELDRRPGISLVELRSTFVMAEIKAHITRLLDVVDRPTALLCEDDNFALAAYRAAHDLGLSVPADLSVVGCDDLPLASLLTPELTTLRLPAEELGRAGVEALLGKEPADAVRAGAPLPTTLIVRGSTAPPRSR
jgi:LacI family transcriptional regulator, repressor for deo operon, udp, cdd, tsx, nupC, and nupG